MVSFAYYIDTRNHTNVPILHLVDDDDIQETFPKINHLQSKFSRYFQCNVLCIFSPFPFHHIGRITNLSLYVLLSI